LSDVTRYSQNLAFISVVIECLNNVLYRRLLPLTALLVVTGIVIASESTERQAKYFNIPAQSLSSALLVFSRQSDKTVVVSNELIDKIRAPQLTGHYSAETALQKLLNNTGLTYVRSGDDAIVVTKIRSDKNPLTNEERNSAAGDSIEEILVSSHQTRAANRKAIEFKRQSLTIMDSYTEGNINSLPDLNIADSFRRLPGTSAVNDSDEGRYVSVRGIESGLNFVTIDGMAIATDEEGSRRVNLEAIPAMAMKTLEVYKIQTAEMDGNAIGGTLNMVSRSAYDSDDLFVFLKSQLSHYTLDDVPDDDDGLGKSFDAIYSDTLGVNKQWGVVLSASFNQKKRDEQKTSNDVYSYDNPLESPVNDRIRTLQYTNTWKRYGGAVKFEYRPSEKLHASVNTFYYTMKETESRYFESLERAGELTQYSATRGRVGQANNKFRYTHRPTERDTGGSQFHVLYTPDSKRRFSTAIAYSKATLYLPDHDVSYNTGATDELGYLYDMSGTYTAYTLNNPSYITDPDNYLLAEALIDLYQREDEVLEYRVDYAVNAQADSRGWGYKVGIKYRQLERQHDHDRQRLQLKGTATLELADFTKDTKFIPEHYDHSIFIFDYDVFFDQIARNPSLYQFENDIRASTVSDFLFKENVAAGYAMLSFSDRRFFLSFGLRYENTHNSSVGWFDSGQALKQVSNSGDYDNVLPSIYFHYDINDSLRLRTGYSQSMGRAGPGTLSAKESLSISSDGSYQFQRGNPDLLPRISDNYDISLECYFDNSESLLAVTLFKKDIDNLIYDVTSQEVVNGDLVSVKQAKNADRAYINGIELSMIKATFTSLPDALKGLGVSANATWIDAGMYSYNEQGQRIHTDHLNEQADFIANVTLSYRYKYFGMHVAYNHTGAFAESFRSDGNNREETWWEPYEQIDVRTTFDVSESLSVNLSVRNLTNRYRFRTTGEYRQLFSEDVKFGRSYWLGFSYQY
jgi:iron complex outermembrane recepter protein